MLYKHSNASKGKSYFPKNAMVCNSDLAIQLEGAGEEEYTGYGQSCLFFKSQFFHAVINNIVKKELAWAPN